MQPLDRALNEQRDVLVKLLNLIMSTVTLANIESNVSKLKRKDD